jgi:anti-sigma regulatory factor (Ser/Thr protein kinase)
MAQWWSSSSGDLVRSPAAPLLPSLMVYEMVRHLRGERPVPTDSEPTVSNEPLGRASTEHQRLRHDAYLYDNRQRYVADLLAFVRRGIACRNPVLIAVPGPHLELVAAELSAAETSQVRMHDMSRIGRNPGRIIGLLSAFVLEQRPAAGLRIVSEAVWPDRTDQEYPACVEHEALLNVALAEVPAHVVCPYDTVHLPQGMLSDAARTHPTLRRGDERRDSPSYADPHTTAALTDHPLSVPPDNAEIVVVNTITGPRTARRFAYEFGKRVKLPAAQLDPLMITVHELAVNTILHGGGAGLMSLWTTDHELVVQIDDGGRITDPLVGRRPPGPSEIGHGLHVVHQVADLVRVHRGSDGTTVRVCFRLSAG